VPRLKAQWATKKKERLCSASQRDGYLSYVSTRR